MLWGPTRPIKTLIVVIVLLVAPTADFFWFDSGIAGGLVTFFGPIAGLFWLMVVGMVWVTFPLTPSERRHVRQCRFAWLRTVKLTRWRVGNVVSLALLLLVGFIWVRSDWRADILAIALSPTRMVEVSSLCGLIQIDKDEYASGHGVDGIEWSVGHHPSRSGGPFLGFGFASRPSPSGATSYLGLVPWWFPSLIFAIAPAMALIRGYRCFRREATSRCLHCGYDLTGNISGVCPECGTEVER